MVVVAVEFVTTEVEVEAAADEVLGATDVVVVEAGAADVDCGRSQSQL